MSTSSATSCRRTLAAGAALLGCSLVATEVQAQSTYFSTLSNLSATASASAGGSSFTYSTAGPATYILHSESQEWGTDPNYYHAGFQLHLYGNMAGAQQRDHFLVLLTNEVPSNFTSAGSFTMTFATDVDWFDSYVAEAWSNWTVDGNTLADGQRILAGTHIFTWSLNNVIGTSVGGGSTAGIGGYFVQASASGVPLPGAAGLAACGLLGMSRRRRR